VRVKLDDRTLDASRWFGGANQEVKVPLKELAGKHALLVLTGDGETPSAFALEARYVRPTSAGGTHIGMRASNGLSIHRVYTDPAGNPIDLSKVKAGQVVRVALRVALPNVASYRRAYLAVTDRLPAGLEAVMPDLATVASVPDIARAHPFYEGLVSYGGTASHVDLRDDRALVYFDRTYGDVVYATYLARATTPGQFAVPPASGELMYEQDSAGWSDAAQIVIE
jgi:uncharacterized protein YfaS (alpha-2-macroglobulin family)